LTDMYDENLNKLGPSEKEKAEPHG
jgi:hypothetical protein